MSEYASLPLGVAILAVVVGLFGAVVLVAGLIVLLIALFHLAAMGWTGAFGTGVLSGLVTLVIGAIVLGVAFGLWHRELWAYVLALLSVAVAFGWFVVLPILNGATLSSLVSVPAIVSGLLFIYLLVVHDHFS